MVDSASSADWLGRCVAPVLLPLRTVGDDEKMLLLL